MRQTAVLNFFIISLILTTAFLSQKSFFAEKGVLGLINLENQAKATLGASQKMFVKIWPFKSPSAATSGEEPIKTSSTEESGNHLIFKNENEKKSANTSKQKGNSVIKNNNSSCQVFELIQTSSFLKSSSN